MTHTVTCTGNKRRVSERSVLTSLRYSFLFYVIFMTCDINLPMTSAAMAVGFFSMSLLIILLADFEEGLRMLADRADIGSFGA